MTQKAILFDLDGTLTDSAEGILNCVAPALEHFGLPVYDRETMIVFVGPPLFETFPKFGVPADGVQTAIDIFRARYTTVGKFENTPFPGIREMLATLRAQGHTLYIATSKPEQQAREILEHFDLAQYFDIIAGAATDKSRATKEEVIAYLKEQAGAIGQAIMVGDTIFDVQGAVAHNIPGIGVQWGYGKVEDMIAAGASAIATSPEHLVELLNA